MKSSISKNKNFISINFYNIDYKRIISLFNLLKIEIVSIFIDEDIKYTFSRCIYTKDLEKYVINLKESLLIFDGIVKECVIDKEIDILKEKKLFVSTDLGERLTSILINRHKTNVSIDDIKKI